MARVALALATLWLGTTAFAATYYVAQVGANQGLLAGGVGGDYGRLSWATTLGITPSAADDVLITQVNGKCGYAVLDDEAYRLLLGGALLINPSRRTFFVVPEKYPDRYYPANAYFFALQTTLVWRHGYFVEASILDYYLTLLAENPRGSINNSALVSLGFGKNF